MNVRSSRSHALPKTLLSLSLMAAGFAAWGSAEAATFYVRADGGDAAQCTGRADAPIRAAAPPRPAPGRIPTSPCPLPAPRASPVATPC